MVLFLTLSPAMADTHYVSLTGSHVPPFTNWNDAAQTIQAAIDVASSNDTVLVTNGVYAAGSTLAGGIATRVAITNALTVTSVNGTNFTSIVGRGPLGDTAIRCAYLADGAVLSGFTLTNGHTEVTGGGFARDGGGVLSDADGVISNCVIVACRAYVAGGGVYGGSVTACELRGNSAEHGGAAAYATVTMSTLAGNSANWQGGGMRGGTATQCDLLGNSGRFGGGASETTLTRCVLRGNSASHSGGGVEDGVVLDSTIDANTAGSGGGLAGTTAERCTITSNTAHSGGGSWGGTLEGCVLRANTATLKGGGSQDGVLSNCLLTGNEASSDGGGLYFRWSEHKAVNCTIVANHSGGRGGGVSLDSGSVQNSIVYHNTAFADGDNWQGAHGSSSRYWQYCCTTPDPGGTAIITDIPRIDSLAYGHITSNSPCVDAGSNVYVAGPHDLDGQERIWGGTVDIGCDEMLPHSVTGGIAVAVTVVDTGAVVGASLDFEASIAGRALGFVWDWGDGEESSGALSAAHAYAAAGDYSVVLRAWNQTVSVAQTVRVHVASAYTNYVSFAGTATAPYANWATAATNLQDAVDACLVGGTVLVAEGVYTNGTHMHGGVLHRVGLWKHLTVAADSTNAGLTVIAGEGPVGASAVRCAYVADGATLCGFTLTNGHSLSSGDAYVQRSGGGAWCEGGGTVSNCTVAGCAASSYAGGIYGGRASECAIRGNNAGSGGGAAYCDLDNCELDGNTAGNQGGGAYAGTLTRCEANGNSAKDGGGVAAATVTESTLRANTASSGGGGATGSTLNGCLAALNTASSVGGGVANCTVESSLIVSNTSSYSGGGAHGGILTRCELRANRAEGRAGGGANDAVLRSCLVIGNEAAQMGGGIQLDHQSAYNCTIVGNYSRGRGGGVATADGRTYNSIVYHNTALVTGDNWSQNYNPPRGRYDYCCITPNPGGSGNVTNLPLLVGIDNGHIVVASPCVDAGSDALAGGSVDFDGETRISGSAVDIGCDEVVAGVVTGSMAVAIAGVSTSVVAGSSLQFTAQIEGRPTGYAWLWGDGKATSNAWSVSHAYASAGNYELVLRAWNDSDAASATVGIHVVSGHTNYVALLGSGEAPYASWATAATNLQDAVDACLAGGTVLVAEGVYSNGTYAHVGVPHRVGLWRPVTLKAANTNAGATVITGVGPVGSGAMRCAYIGDGAALCGFTLTNGHSLSSGHGHEQRSGGGAWCEDGGTVSNCVVVGCAASAYAGGIYGGRAVGCVARGNRAVSGGGAAYCELHGGVLVQNTASNEGGGAYGGTLTRCEVSGNSAKDGGGVASATVTESTLRANTASTGGGGAADCTVNDCLVEHNTASSFGGGVAGGSAQSCLIVSNTAFYSGGGAYNATLTGCELRANLADGREGGGAAESNLRSCLVIGNEAAQMGGGVGLRLSGQSARNCTIVGNHSRGKGGGVSPGDGAVYNSIVYHNTALSYGDNWAPQYDATRGRYGYCCITPDPGGGGNITNLPLLVSLYNGHIVATSPCVDAGLDSLAGGNMDFDGESRISGGAVDIGCDEVVAGAVTGSMAVAIAGVSTSVVAGSSLQFTAQIEGRPTGYAWLWGDGKATSNAWSVSHAYAAAGDYELVLQARNDGGTASATVGIHVVSGYTNYVAPSGSGEAPFASWATAATNLQDAVDACLAGGTVLVAEGVYENGNHDHEGVPHRVGLWKPVTVMATNTNADATVVVGVGPVGSDAMRCAYVADGAALCGFTLTNGHSLSSGHGHEQRSGGGAWCEDGGTISNCTVSGCAASAYAGGVYGGRAVSCVVRGNHAVSGGGAAYCALDSCVLEENTASNEGGGAYAGTMTRCEASGNSAKDGGGVASATVTESTLRANRASTGGGGAADCTVNDCVVERNTASSFGGGIAGGTAQSCLVVSNTSSYSGGGAYNTTLTGCELRANLADGREGGGAAESNLRSCLVIGNEAAQMGGGVGLRLSGQSARNCTIVGNHSRGKGGGVSPGDGAVYNSIVYHNTALSSGDNWAPQYDPTRGQYGHCCITPDPGGSGNVTNLPLLVSIDNGHIVVASPCVDAGSDALAGGSVDFDGEARISGSAVDIGCDEVVAGAVTGKLAVAALGVSTSVVAGASLFFEAQIEGRPTDYAWLWGDGNTTSNAWSVSHAYASAGNYELVLRAWNDSDAASATVGIHVVSGYTNYVTLSGSGETPFASWATAATNLQDAVDACLVGGTVLVAEGVYTNGAYERDGVPHRVGLWKPLTVAAASTNSGLTVIGGAGPVGADAVRCAYIARGATLEGFTLTNGHTLASGDTYSQRSGGGVWCEDGGTVSNCVVAGCAASAYGGGVYGGRAVGCDIRENGAASGGGAAFCTIEDCVLAANTVSGSGGGAYGGSVTRSEASGNGAKNGGGVAVATVGESVLRANTASTGGGGASDCTVTDCVVERNTASSFGGGIAGGTAQSCLVVSNTSSYSGGGAYNATLTRCELRANRATGRAGGGACESSLRNCLVVGNEAAVMGGGVDLRLGNQSVRNCTIVGNHSGGTGGGLAANTGNAHNSIVYHNTAAASGDNWAPHFQSLGGTLSHCCITPHPGGSGHVTEAPLFVGLSVTNLRLKAGSPCINAGLNEDWMFAATDLDGRSRILNDVVDMGAYETPFVLDVRVMLEGAYRQGPSPMAAMPHILPISSPYILDTRCVPLIPSNVTDWVVLQLRGAGDERAGVTRSVWVGNSGYLVNDAGERGIVVPVVEGRDYYVTVRHRNHLGTQSLSPVPFVASSTSYDFTTGPGKALGGSNACVELEPGVWGMIAGDCDGDGKITAVDRAIVSNQVGKTGYLAGDLNLDGVVTEEDVP